MNFIESLNENIQNIKTLISDSELQSRIESAIKILTENVLQENPILICGNGGSAADAEHITGELVGRFLKERKAINAISLNSNSAAITAWSNDYEYESVFERQVEAHGKNGGVVFLISTSGNSENTLRAAKKAKEMKLKVISLTGESGGRLKDFSDVLLNVPSTKTPRIQEMHILIYHYICEEIEKRYAG